MRWFKHISNAHQDEKMARLVSELGLEGYGFYWLILETVAGQIEAGSDRTDLDYPIAFWREITGFSPKKLRKFAEFCSEIEIFSAKFSENSLTIDIPNILKYREVNAARVLDVSSIEWRVLRKAVFKRDSFTCQYCGKPVEKPDCDHVMPLSRGGLSTMDNLVTACPSCNRSKNDKTPEEWMQ